MRLSRGQCPTACFLRLVRPTTRKKCQFGAKVLASCSCCSRRAPSGTIRGADMSSEAHVKRLSRRQCPSACFLRLVRPTTRQKCQFGAEVLARCCCWCRRAPSGTFRIADRSIEAHSKRLCSGQCCTACFWRLLRLITLENDKFTRKKTIRYFCDPHGSAMRGLPFRNLRGILPPRTRPCGGGGRAQERGVGVSEISCHGSMYI